MIRTLILATLAALCAPALAERADALKPILLSGDRTAEADFAEGTAALVGNVVLKRGTLEIKAEKASTKQDDQGYTHATFWAGAGKKATFRQKRDGGPDLWTEGEADRIEYDEKLDLVTFVGAARVASLEGTRVSSQAVGPFLSYDNRKEQVRIVNSQQGVSQPGGGRVELMFDRRPRTAAPARRRVSIWWSG
jgi:lipopolysaccharide export system protein LptA